MWAASLVCRAVASREGRAGQAQPPLGSAGSAGLPGPGTPPALHGLHAGESCSSGASFGAGSPYPASCSPQLPFAFTPSQHSLSSLHDHPVRSTAALLECLFWLYRPPYNSYIFGLGSTTCACQLAGHAFAACEAWVCMERGGPECITMCFLGPCASSGKLHTFG